MGVLEREAFIRPIYREFVCVLLKPSMWNICPTSKDILPYFNFFKLSFSLNAIKISYFPCIRVKSYMHAERFSYITVKETLSELLSIVLLAF